MDTTNILLIILLVGIVIVIYVLLKPRKASLDQNKILEENAHLKAELTQRDIKIGELANEIKIEKTMKDELSGKNKEVYAEKISIKAERDNLIKDKERITKELSKFQAEEDRKEKNFEDKIQKLDEAKAALDDEKKRIRKEDEEREQKEKDERDRMWAEHEDKVKNQLSELCKSPQYNFQTYDNKNLPEGFSGKLQPDFMIEFLGQYVIFDAKVSKSDNLQNYVNTSVKSTVEKINNDAKIYSMLFFVVPTEAIEALAKTHFHEKSYEIFVVSPEAMPVILAAFKKISSYELAEQMDPRDRENIVNLIAEFDYHINMRNALDILASQSGVSVLKKAGIIKQDIKDEIKLKKSKMRLQQFAPTEIKNLMLDEGIQQGAIDEMISPQASIPSKNVGEVKAIFEEDQKYSE